MALDGAEGALRHHEFWDQRYANSDGQTPIKEWYRLFKDLEPFLYRYLFDLSAMPEDQQPQILHLGSGDSAIPQELSARGYRRQLCVDFSPVVVQLMSTRHRDLAGVEWKLMDVRDMAAIPDRSVYIAFDKGTLDSMIHGSPWTPPDDVRESTARYMKEVGRVLEDNGVFLCISFRQPHFVKPLLSQGGAWDIDVEVVGDEGHFGYQAFIMKKHTAGSRAGRCVEAEV